MSVLKRILLLSDNVLYRLKYALQKRKLLSQLESGLEPHLIFTGHQLQPRIPRLLKSLGTSFGRDVGLMINRSAATKHHDTNIPEPVFYKNKWELLMNILKLKNANVLIHGFEPRPAVLAFLHKKMPGKVNAKYIFDFQDIYINYFGPNPPYRWIKKDLQPERYCLSHYDGQICNSLEISEANKLYGIPKKPRIFFPLYIDERNIQQPKQNPYNGTWKVVYAGNITAASPDKFKGIGQFHHLIELFSTQAIEFHIYPSPGVSAGTIKEYETLAAKYPRFHIHKSLNQKDLALALANYHFAIIPFFREDSNETAVKYKYANTLKLFNYFEAGIPVLVSKDLEFQSWICERYNFGRSISYKDLGNLEGVLNDSVYNSMIDSYTENRKSLFIDRHIPRLVAFYSSIWKS